jgi:hypothetical protein
MLTRCRNPNTITYSNYGGRGIRVCERWTNSFMAFYEDMGEPLAGMTLERNDVDGDYCPENCRWATRKEQARNTRRNKFVEFNGERKTVAEWAEIYGLNPINLNKRLRRGCPVHIALTSPNRPDGTRLLLTRKQQAILEFVRSGPKRVTAIVQAIGRSRHCTDQAVAALVKSGFAERVDVGVYAITEAGIAAVMPLTLDR